MGTAMFWVEACKRRIRTKVQKSDQAGPPETKIASCSMIGVCYPLASIASALYQIAPAAIFFAAPTLAGVGIVQWFVSRHAKTT